LVRVYVIGGVAFQEWFQNIETTAVSSHCQVQKNKVSYHRNSSSNFTSVPAAHKHMDTHPTQSLYLSCACAQGVIIRTKCS